MNKVFIGVVFIFFLFLSGQGYSQTTDDNLVKIANDMFGFGDKKDALGVYLQALEINPENINANFMAGRCYLETVQKELSVTYLIKAYTLKADIAPDILFKIGNGYQFGGSFNEAITYYKKYKENLTDEMAFKLKSTVRDEIIKVDRRIYECTNGIEYFKDPKNYRIENIKDVVNSEFPDYAPTVNADNTILFFTSRRSGGVGKNKDIDNEYFEDVWFSKKVNGAWTSPKNMGKPINTETHDASIGLSKDGKELFVYKAENGGDIYISKQEKDGSWSSPNNMGKIVNTKNNEPSVSISNDEKTLYFSSDRPGGFGGLDIYKAEKDKYGDWGRVVNLGSTINTEYDEDSPFIDIDGKTLYFSSRGHKGMGGFDIYRCTFDAPKKTWSQPENLGFPINSPDDDIYFVKTGDEKYGYFASAKKDGYGDKDIYIIYLKPDEERADSIAKNIIPKKDSLQKKILVKKDSANQKIVKKTWKKDTSSLVSKTFIKDNYTKNTIKTILHDNIKEQEPKISYKGPLINKFPTIIKGRVSDYYSGESLSARIVVNDLKGNVLSVLDVKPDGLFTTEISQNATAKFSITATKDGYIYSNITVSVPANSKYQQTIKRDFSLKKIGIGEIFILRNIYYDFDKDQIRSVSLPFLDKLVAWMKSHPKVHLEIGGHTDNYGSDKYNKFLSQRRVNAVLRYAVAKGIDSHRMIAIGYGEERPLASNDDEKEGREINRRTEFKITKK